MQHTRQFVLGVCLCDQFVNLNVEVSIVISTNSGAFHFQLCWLDSLKMTTQEMKENLELYHDQTLHVL